MDLTFTPIEHDAFWSEEKLLIERPRIENVKAIDWNPREHASIEMLVSRSK